MRRRGLVLILAIFFIGLLQLLILAFARRLPLELSGSIRYELDNAAFLAADAGIQHTLGWLEEKLEQEVEPVPSLPGVTRTGELNGFRWEVDVRPDAQTPPNVPPGGQRAYMLESRAMRSAVVYRKISVGLVQKSFAYYSRLVDDWPATIVSLAGEEGYSGPVHTNSALHVGLSTDYVTTGPVLFRSGVSFTVRTPGNPEKVDYHSFFTGPRPYAGATAAIRKTRYKRLYGENGRQGVVRAKAVPMPSPDENVRRAAWGAPPYPGGPGLHVNASGSALNAGVYINGDVDEMELGNGFERIRLASGDQYVITERTDGTTEVTGPGPAAGSYTNHPNGVIYCSGDVRGLYGRNRGPHTIAVNTQNNRQIHLGGGLVPATSLSAPLGKPPDDGSDALGLIAHSLVLPAGLSRSSPLYVYGALLLCGGDGQGGVLVENAGSGDFGDLYFVGSVTTQRTHITMMPTPPTGWATHYAYDESLQWAPPPAFPGLSALRVVAYSVE